MYKVLQLPPQLKAEEYILLTVVDFPPYGHEPVLAL